MAGTDVCKVDGCARGARARGWCIGHYNRWHRSGDPGPAELPLQRGENHHSWKSQPGYGSVHKRIQNSRGKAAKQRCDECGEPAKEWAYTDPEVDSARLVDDLGRPYSTNVDLYRPLCKPCHLRADVHEHANACPQGHEYDEANTYIGPSGYRQCRTCNRDRAAQKRELR